MAGLYWGLDWPKLAQSHMARSDQGHIFLAWAWYRLCIWLCGLYLDWPRPNWHGFVRVKWHGLAKFTWPGLTKTTLIKGSGRVQGMYFDILAWKMLSHMIRVTEPGNIRYSLGFDIRKANIESSNMKIMYSNIRYSKLSNI